MFGLVAVLVPHKIILNKHTVQAAVQISPSFPHCICGSAVYTTDCCGDFCLARCEQISKINK